TNSIKKTSVANEFLVQSTRQDNIYYVVNSGMDVYTCPVGAFGAPCKYQSAITIKYHIAMFNFIPSLTPKDRIIYSYIALDNGTPNESFDEATKWREDEGIGDISIFLEEIKMDYENSSPQLRIALDKFAER
ncbi:22295_t:CDS:2, partial [Dentiscutata erythropus]